MNKKFIILFIIIIFIALFLRLFLLGQTPYGSPDDEASYIYNAYSIWHTGKSLDGQTFPLSFNAHSSQSPVPVYLTAPFVAIDLNLFLARLLPALMGVGTTTVLFFIAHHFLKNKWIALLSALLFAVSPWALQANRGLWDIDFSSFFFMFAILIFIKNTKTSNYLWSLIPFLLGFYSYHATKVYFIFLIPLLIFFYRKDLFISKKRLTLFILGSLFIVISFLFVLKLQNVTRQSETSLISNPNASRVINEEREKNSAPYFLRPIFSNKPLYFLRTIRENYFETFSTNFLFLYGEVGSGSDIYNIYYRGELYFLELPLLLIGLYFLFSSKNKQTRNLLIGLALISPLPSTFTSDKNFINRDFMLLPILLIVISIGLYHLILIIRRLPKISRFILLTVLTITYLFSITSYLYQYHFRWSVYGAEAWGASNRDAIALIQKIKPQHSIVAPLSKQNFLLQYALFTKTDPAKIQQIWNDKTITIDNLTITDDCLSDKIPPQKSLPKNSLYLASASKCNNSFPPNMKINHRGEPQQTIWNIYSN